jgi:hypothetical protein
MSMRREKNAWFWLRKRERGQEKEIETTLWEKKSKKDKAPSVLILVFWVSFKNKIIDEILNINIFNIYISDFVCKVKLKFNGLGIWAVFTNRIIDKKLNINILIFSSVIMFVKSNENF